MLTHHSHHPRQRRPREQSPNSDLNSAQHASSSTSCVDVVRRSSRERARASRPLAIRPVPLLHRGSLSMSAVPTKRVLATTDEFVRPVSPDSEGLGRTAKLFAAMRRSNSYSHRKAEKGSSDRGMYSTPEERSASPNRTPLRSASPVRTAQPPSIAQIAMGLHTSRTPHLGPSSLLQVSEQGARSAAHAYARGRVSASPPSSRPQTASSSTRVAPPLRSSLKKAAQSRSTSPSASASSIPSTPRSTLSRISLALSGTSGRSRLDKFLGRGLKSPISSVSSLNSSEGELGSPRKAVRFMPVVEDKAEGGGIS